VKPASASAVPEAGIGIPARVSGPPRRFPSHRAFFCQGWVVPAESGNIDAGNPVILRRLFFPGGRRVRIRSQALKRAKKARQAIGKAAQRVT